MPRPILEECRIHPAIRDKVATNRIDECSATLTSRTDLPADLVVFASTTGP